jgi:hypothetical protein
VATVVFGAARAAWAWGFTGAGTETDSSIAVWAIGIVVASCGEGGTAQLGPAASATVGAAVKAVAKMKYRMQGSFLPGSLTSTDANGTHYSLVARTSPLPPPARDEGNLKCKLTSDGRRKSQRR